MVTRNFLPCALFCALSIVMFSLSTARAQDSKYASDEPQIPGPECLSVDRIGDRDFRFCTPQEQKDWLADAGDTEHGVARAFPDAADKVGHPLVFEPELGPDDEALAYNLMSWGHFKYPFAPTVDRYKWIEPRHMVNISDR